ncbi:MAG TPA: CHAT domain-containing protein [Longimicrobium sp.]|nr:CHAT domain-containing protein [Longimicrobium sp.]
MPGTVKVLLMAADSGEGAAGLRLDHEIRGALEAVRVGRAAYELEIAAELAVRADDLRHALLRHDPQIVHFAGHGDRVNGLVFDDGSRVGADELVALLSTFRDVRVVVLNACDTLSVAKALSEVVDYTVGMELPIDDAAAIRFSAEFYAALAFGRTVPFAFDLARKAIDGRHGQPQAIPHLLVRPSADERPLQGKAAPQGPAAASRTQLIEAEEVEVGGDAEASNVARGTAGAPASQGIKLRGVKAGGSLKLGSKLE